MDLHKKFTFAIIIFLVLLSSGALVYSSIRDELKEHHDKLIKHIKSNTHKSHQLKRR